MSVVLFAGIVLYAWTVIAVPVGLFLAAVIKLGDRRQGESTPEPAYVPRTWVA